MGLISVLKRVINNPKKLTDTESSPIRLDRRGVGYNRSKRCHKQSENVVRDQFGDAIDLLDLMANCPEAATAIQTICQDVPMSYDGSDTSIDVECDDAIIKVEISEILRVFFTPTNLELITKQILSYGDCFWELAFDIPNQTISDYQFLPPLEIFKTLDPLNYTWTPFIGSTNAITIPGIKVIHWRFRPGLVYGTGLFQEVIDDWLKLDRLVGTVLPQAVEDSITPFIHEMPNSSSEYRLSYKEFIRELLLEGPLRNLFLYPGEKVYRVPGTASSLEDLNKTIDFHRKRIITKSRIPPYLFGIIEGSKGTDLSSQPALAYVRFICSIRGRLTEGIRLLIQLQLELKGLDLSTPYNLVWPEFRVSVGAEKNGDDTD